MSSEPAVGSARADILHTQRDENYERLLREEAAYWDAPQLFGVDLGDPIVGAYTNERFTGNATIPWHETIPRYGVFRRGLSLGTSGLKLEAAMLRANPSLRLTFCDISPASLEARERELGEQFPGRVATLRSDLNFIELEPESYDLVVSSSSVHHLSNLEHVAYEVNRALTPAGRFFLQDYTGESKFGFTPEKRRVIESLFADGRRRHRELRGWHVEWPDMTQYSPFEAIRSAEILGVFRDYLDEVLVRSCGSIMTMFLLMRPDDPARPRSRSLWQRLRGAAAGREAAIHAFAPEIFWLDALLTDTGALRPANSFAVYRKRAS